MDSTVFNKNNKFLIPIIIILLIPTFFAIFFAANPGEIDSMPSDVSIIRVEYAQLGINEVFDAETDVDTYMNAILRAEKISADYRDVSTEIPFKVTAETNNAEEAAVYEFFMKYDRDECIYRTVSDGSYYLLKSDDALNLLEREEFKSINKTANVPYAFAGTNSVPLVPSSGEWNHVIADGSFVTENVNAAELNVIPVKISANGLGSLSFGAQTVPDAVNVKISLGAEVKHEGAYENMLNANIIAANDTYYDMEITATWNEKEDVDYYGTLVYTAQLFYDVSPTYEVVFGGSVIRGDFGILKIQNFNDGDKLLVASEFSLPSELQVFRAPLGYSFAFIPVEIWTQGAIGSYDVTLSLEDGSSQIVRINVKDSPRLKPALESQEMLITELDVAESFTEEAFNQFNSIVAEKTAATEPSQLWVDKFVYPNASNQKNRGNGMADYGTLRTVNASGLYTNAYYHNGIDFTMTGGESVLASNNGKVVFAGELTLTGKTVIIDHGCSILSYYGHLDSINVTEGAIVNKASTIGTAGKTGFAVAASGATASSATQVHFAISIGGKFVSPHFLWDGGVNFGD